MKWFDRVGTLFKYQFARCSVTYKKISTKIENRYVKMQSYLKPVETNKHIYKDLTPTENKKDYKEYIEAIDWALSRDNIVNIALTGPYGSGKSSILKTYKATRPHYNYLNISVATFHTYINSQVAKKGTDCSEKSLKDDNRIIKELEENEIEKRILQQLFYRVDSKKASFSRFRKINHIKTASIIKSIATLVGTIVMASILLFPQKTLDILDKLGENHLLLEGKHIAFPIQIIGFLLLGALLITLIVTTIKSVYKSIRLSKFSIKDFDVEVNTEKNDSIFNKYIDEILYLFEINPYDVVFIEDLDRFNDISIFMKLRELNSLINNSEQINRKVVFIYAIKDDLFINKDRTKFFDYIIPVIPIINSTNSGEVFWKQLVDNNLADGIPEDFISDVCLYINDMRILNNIFNEYVVYKNKLFSGEESFLDPKRMLAMIIYKNIFPNDFAQLQQDKGYVYNIFKSKKKIINEYVDALNKEYKGLEKEIERSKNELLQSVKELKMIYWNVATNHTTGVYDIRINDNYYTLPQVLEDNFDISIIKNNYYYRHYVPGYSFREQYYTLDENKRNSLLERVNDIENKASEYRSRIQGNMEEIKWQINDAKSWSLKQAIDILGLDKMIPESTEENKLIKFLLRKEYIDEMYPNYMNNFYGGSLTHQDMVFIMRVKDRIELEHSHPLTNIEKVIGKLNIKEFETKEILNYDMMNYLLKMDEKYKEQLDTVMTQLSNGSSSSIDFIDSFIEVVDHEGKFVNLLCKKWIKIWDFIIYNTNISDQRKHKYVDLIQRHSDISDIVTMSEKNNIVEYLEEIPSYLEFSLGDDAYREKQKEIIKRLNIQFSNLVVTDKADKELLNYIIDNNFYELNFHMVKVATKLRSTISEEILITEHLTSIKAIGDAGIWCYITQNIENYMEDVVLQLKDNHNESEDMVLEILNLDLDTIDLEIKKKFLISQNTLISDIKSIPKNLWDYVVENSKMKATWSNTLTKFLEEEVLSHELIKYLNSPSNYLELTKVKMNCENNCEEDVYDHFAKELIYNNSMADNTLNALKNSMLSKLSDLETEKISRERLLFIIKYGMIEFTESDFRSIRTNHKSVLASYISENIIGFLDDYSKYEVDNQDIYNLLLHDDKHNAYKLKIIEEFDDTINCNSKAYAELLYDIITKSRKKVKLSENLLESIISNDITDDKKVKLILNQKEYVNYGKMKDYLSNFKYPYDEIMKLRCKPKLVVTDYNREFIRLLDSKRLISSFNEDKKYIRVVALYR